MNTQRLKYFICAAENLNFTRTAEQFFISQTAISAQIKALEDELGAALFTREKKRLKLTSAGHYFYDEARRMIAIEEVTKRKARALASAEGDSIAIGLFSDVVGDAAGLIIRSFVRENPAVSLSFQSGSDADLMELLNAGSLDCVLTRHPAGYDYGGFHHRIIHRYPLGVVVPPGHPFASRARVSEDMLEKERLILLQSDLERIQAFEGSPLPERARSVVADGVASLHAMLAAGMGLCILPSPHGPDIARDLDLIFVPIEDAERTDNLVAVWSRDEQNRALRRFTESVDAYAARGGR